VDLVKSIANDILVTVVGLAVDLLFLLLSVCLRVFVSLRVLLQLVLDHFFDRAIINDSVVVHVIDAMHVAVLSVAAQHSHELFNLIEKRLNFSFLGISEVLVLVLLLLEHFEVLFTGSDEVLLDVKVEVIQIILSVIQDWTLVPDEVIVVMEDLLTVVVDQVTQLF